MQPVCAYTDYFVVATGGNARQTKGIFDEVHGRMQYDVYRPVIEGGRYDLIFDTGERLLRVQCKWAPLHGEVVVIRSYSSRRARIGLVRRAYVQGEFDALAAFCPQLERCYLIPFEVIDGALQIHLRIAPTRNNQHIGV